MTGEFCDSCLRWIVAGLAVGAVGGMLGIAGMLWWTLGGYR
jgi:hypothetical protein